MFSSRVTLIKKRPLSESQLDKAILTVSIEQGCGKDPHNACKIPRTVPGTSKALLMLVFSATGSLMTFPRLSSFYHLGVIKLSLFILIPNTALNKKGFVSAWGDGSVVKVLAVQV